MGTLKVPLVDSLIEISIGWSVARAACVDLQGRSSAKTIGRLFSEVVPEGRVGSGLSISQLDWLLMKDKVGVFVGEVVHCPLVGEEDHRVLELVGAEVDAAGHQQGGRIE